MGRLFAILLLITSAAATAQTAKERMLRTVVEKAIAPGYARLAEACKALSLAATDLRTMPDAANLEKVRQRWLATAMAAQEMESIRSGPISDGSDAAAFYFVEVRPSGIEQATRATTKPAEVAELGATAKGLYAIEYLVFPKGDRTIAADGEGENRRRYLTLISTELAELAERIARGWRKPYAPSAETFLNGGQDSLNKLVNQLAKASENVTRTRLVALEGGKPRAGHEKIPGTVSGRHHFLLLSSYRGLAGIHRGGLLEYTRRINPSLADTLDQRLASTVASLAAIDRQLEFTKPEEARLIADVYQNCNELDVLLKVDLPGTLGVTLTSFGSDGD